MNMLQLRVAVVAVSIGFSGTVDALAQTSDKNLKNVRGISPAVLIGTVCSGTFEVPGSRSDRDHARSRSNSSKPTIFCA
jgi:hypothetical protein